MTPQPEPDLRQAVLAVSVLEDVDLCPTDDGVLLPGPPAVQVGWSEVRQVLDGGTAQDAEARRRLADRLRLHAQLAAAAARPGGVVGLLRVVGVPAGSVRHPGDAWVRTRVLGQALDLGPGFVGLDPTRPEEVQIAPQEVLDAHGLDVAAGWPDALRHLEAMGALAADRFRRNPDAPLRPLGDCDVVTLLGSRTLRQALVADVKGMRAVVVPMRSRGWLDLRRVDPAFALSAAAATDEHERGFSRPLLLTADEVAEPMAGGRAVELELREPALDTRRPAERTRVQPDYFTVRRSPDSSRRTSGGGPAG